MAKSMVKIEDGTVTNIIWCSDGEPETDTLIAPGERTVCIGDTYIGGKFYRDGVEILTPLEEARKQIAALMANMRELDEAYQEGVNSL